MKSLTTLFTAGLLFCSPALAVTAKAQTTIATLTLIATYADEEKDSNDKTEKEDQPDAEKVPGEDSKVKINGTVILIGPDGEKKEFNISDPKTGTFLLEIGGDNNADEKPEPETGTDKEAVESEAVKLEERYVIGVQCEDASEVLRVHLGIADKGVVINEVREETPAAEAGLQKFDVVLKIDDKELLSREDLINCVLESEGKKLELAIIREGKPRFIQVTPLKMKVPVATAPSTMDFNALSGLTGAGQQIRLRLSHPGVLIEESMPQDQEEISRLVERIRSTAGDEAAKSMIDARDAMMLRAAQRQLRSEEQTKALNETLKSLQDQMKGLEEQMKSLQGQLPKAD